MVERLARIDSTNAECARRLAAGAEPPFWLSAERQDAGRGRRGRSWSSLAGNLFLSGVVRTTAPLRDAPQLAFLAGLAIADVLEPRVEPGALSLKWPNDVRLAGAKVAGALLETVAAPGAPDGTVTVIVGIGVNLAIAPQGLDQAATCLVEHVRPGATALNAEEAPPAIAGAFMARFGAWQADGFAAQRGAWLARAHGLGKPAEVAGVTGVIEGLDTDGALVLRTRDGLKRIEAGDVALLAEEAGQGQS